jgi:hypothetical protein
MWLIASLLHLPYGVAKPKLLLSMLTLTVSADVGQGLPLRKPKEARYHFVFIE